ncbi:hypothetical protein [Desulfovibrio ferrophilus]|uniref:Uncharacterized protein n=1 Tax=Desulfovibrio ferrophilus TaxID=241368 RepID=A0A2Z6AZ02_9BACT|nr:hypothetical protein [Desulfovibrio ferrophilus]BBD08482.1 uncharacterized protein DFE_1756 [Desulfovibrio ferrophilus]
MMTERIEQDNLDIGICPRRKRKKMLHILNSVPDDTQRKLISTLSLGYHTMEFPLYEENTDGDYDELIELIFEYDEVVSWW